MIRYNLQLLPSKGVGIVCFAGGCGLDDHGQVPGGWFTVSPDTGDPRPGEKVEFYWLSFVVPGLIKSKQYRKERVIMSQLYELYKALGNKAFSEKVCEMAPYFSTIEPLFVHLRPGYSEVTMPNTGKVHNHLGTVHAIAMCNLAEIAAGIMTDVSIPDNCRWIPVGMDVDYLARATTDLTGVADGSEVDWTGPGDLAVPVVICDDNGLEVCKARVRIKVSLLKKEDPARA